MNRREVLRRLGLAGGASLLSALSGCRPGAPLRRSSSPPVLIDDSFARLVLREPAGQERDSRASLLAHPALDAMVRHQRMSGNAEATADALLERVLQSARSTPLAGRVLERWSGRHGELGEFVRAASLHLPSGTHFTGTLHLIAGYDIGFAAPPDIALNVGHPRFQADPVELAFYATHEAHHAGFLALRKAPELVGLNDPSRLRAVVRFMTQMEGMGVHAAYALRARDARLEADEDYRLYYDASERERVTARYAELMATLSPAAELRDEEVGLLLEAMSSGERVWYRFGALAAWSLERTRGREALAGSIANPQRFWAAANDLLRR